MLTLVRSGIPAESILVLVPQRTLAHPYYDAIHDPSFPAGGIPDIVTLGGLGQRLISLFWPLIARSSGFAKTDQPLSFLTLETAQYFMARLVKPLLDEGFFDSVAIDRNRLLSQIVDNLNKAASVGFSHTEIGERLTQAWIGEPSQSRIYQDAQTCANLFRQFCLDHNLLDFSLQLEIFTHHLWPSFICKQYLFSRYQHLIYDNIEEDIPVTHDILKQWLGHFTSALLIYDTDGGFRSFLGADPESAFSLQSVCDQVSTLSHSWVTSPVLESFSTSLERNILQQDSSSPLPEVRQSVRFSSYHFSPQMIDGICQQVNTLVNEQGVPPGEIAILAPFLSDSLRFSIMNNLASLGIPCHSHRPSRSLRDEPATRCLLTFAKLAHPQWKMPITRFEFRSALMQSIEGLDLVRADIISQIVIPKGKKEQALGTFTIIRPETQERITYLLGEKYEALAEWLSSYQSSPPVELDIFLSRFFGEILSQPGFGFHNQFDAASVTARLIESVQKFRRGTQAVQMEATNSLGCEYIQMVDEGIMAAQYLQPWFDQPADSIFIAPAYTFLMANRPVSYQFWLDIGSQGWWQRLFQPLTHPIVLSRHWSPGQIWTDGHEFGANQQQLSRLVTGLIRRCRRGIYMNFLGINEQGREQRGMLLTALQKIQRRLPPEEPVND